MSVSMTNLNSKNTTIIIGNPGCGKTTTLVRKVEDLMKAGTSPQNIAYLSFSNAAVDEALSRALKILNQPYQREKAVLQNSLLHTSENSIKSFLKKEGPKKYTARDLQYFRTIHSMCFLLLGLSSELVMTENNLKEFSELVHLPLVTSIQALIQGTKGSMITARQTKGDMIMSAIQTATLSGIPLRDYLIQSKVLSQPNTVRGSVDIAYAEYIEEHYNLYKQSRSLYDFTDMLQFAATSDLDTPYLDYLIIDEAQDLSALQWLVVNKLAATSDNIIIAGDDKQTINDFNGADVDTFLSLPGKVISLEQSYRVPKTVFDLANRIVNYMTKYRKEGSHWKPRLTEDGGTVQHVDDIPVYEMFNGQWLLLARASFQLEKIKDRLLEIGNIAPLLFVMPNGEPPIDTDILLLAKAIEMFQKRNFDFHKLEVKPTDSLKKQQQKMHYIKMFKKYCIDSPKQQGMSEYLIELLNEKEPWYNLMRKLSPTVLNYVKNIYPRYKEVGNKMFKDAKIKLTTIHKAKGSEADNVLVLMDIPKNPFLTMTSGESDSEAKVFYVAVTRAKKNLYLYTQTQFSRYSYHYFLQNSR